MHNNKSKKTNLKINIRNDAISNDVNFVVDLKGDIETRKKQEQGKSPSVKFEHLWIGLKTRAKKLLIVRLIKFIYNSIASLFNLIYEFNYSVGWLVIFVVRFFWFLGLSILKLFGLPFKVLKPSYKKKEKSKLVRTFKWELFNFKKVLYLAMFLFVAVIPFKVLSFYTKLSIETKKENIINSSKMAIDNFMGAANAAMSMDFNGVDKNLSEANNSFLTAQRQLDDINGFLFTLAAIVPSKNLQLASISRNILVSGQISTDLALDLNAAIENLLDNKKNKSIYFALENFNIYANKAMQESKLLSIQLGKIDPSLLPSEYQAKFIATKDKMALMEGGLKDLIDIANGLHEILGMTEDKRYLLVFQNNTEARATGGFIGSYALADFRNGK
ncbi:MAG: DUF4012 domain-containing protein, partial [Candidatus Falkowbacteria bacterium]|nr:DUF4012 domain-containing protein [Candidatus Falkowbacteria bacterium]